MSFTPYNFTLKQFFCEQVDKLEFTMRYLKITFVRIIISMIGGNMLKELIIMSTERESIPVFITIVFMGLLYYGLTLYVNNRR